MKAINHAGRMYSFFPLEFKTAAFSLSLPNLAYPWRVFQDDYFLSRVRESSVYSAGYECTAPPAMRSNKFPVELAPHTFKICRKEYNGRSLDVLGLTEPLYSRKGRLRYLEIFGMDTIGYGTSAQVVE